MVAFSIKSPFEILFQIYIFEWFHFPVSFHFSVSYIHFQENIDFNLVFGGVSLIFHYFWCNFDPDFIDHSGQLSLVIHRFRGCQFLCQIINSKSSVSALNFIYFLDLDEFPVTLDFLYHNFFLIFFYLIVFISLSSHFISFSSLLSVLVTFNGENFARALNDPTFPLPLLYFLTFVLPTVLLGSVSVGQLVTSMKERNQSIQVSLKFFYLPHRSISFR